jgi:hypothetical protein
MAELVRPLADDALDDSLAAAGSAADAALLPVAERAAARIRGGRDGSADAIDCLTVIHIGLTAALRERRGSTPVAGLSDVLERARDAAADRVRDRKNPVSQTNFILDGSLRQVGVTLQACSAALELRRSTGADDVLRGLLASLSQIHVMWHNLELYELAELTALTRNALTIVVGDRLSVEREEIADYLIGVGELGGRPNYRIQADLLAGAARLMRSRHKAAAPLVDAAWTAIDGELGSKLSFDLARSVILAVGVSDDQRLEPLIETLTDSARGYSNLFAVSDHRLAGLARQFLNCVRSPTSPAGDRLREQILERTGAIADPWRADSALQEIERFEFARDGAPLDPAELARQLGRWRARVWGTGVPGPPVTDTEPPQWYRGGARFLYGFVLQICWSAHGPKCSELVDDVTRIVMECDAAAPSGSDILLADAITDSAGVFSAEVREQAVRILGGIGRVADFRRPASNSRIYRFLAANDPARADEYRERANYWRAVDDTVAQETLVHHVEGRRYFEAFWHHYIRVPELPCRPPREEFEASLEASGPERAAALLGLNTFPEPIAFAVDGTPLAVCGAFLKVGHYVHHPAPDGWGLAGTDEDRMAIDTIAQQHLDLLYLLLIERTDISDEIREIFIRQRNRFNLGDRASR